MATATLAKTKLNLQPLADRVVVQRDEAEERTEGGLFLPDKAREKVNRGRVIAVGPGKLDDTGQRIPLSVKVGDHILMNKYGGEELKVEDSEYVLVREDDILAVIED